MILVLKIVAIVVIVLIVLAISAVTWFVRRVRKFIKDAQDEAPSCPPCRVYPEPEANPQWRTPEQMNKYADEFRKLGFQEIGAFAVPQLQGLLMLAFVHPDERLYGVIYDHKRMEPTFDIVCDLEDGTDINGCSTKIGETLDKRPGHTVYWLGDDRVNVVLDAVLKHPQSAPRVPVSHEGFLTHFKKSYADGVNWRMRKGGASRDEIRRQIVSKGNEVNEEVVENVYKNLRSAYVAEAQRACLAQYLDEQQIPAAEWEHLQSRAFVVPEILETEELIDVLQNAQPLDQEQRHALKQFRKSSPSTIEAIDEILVTDVAAMGLEKLGEVHEPVHAYVLLTPVRENAARAMACA